MEPKYFAFWRWLDSLIIWEYDWMPRDNKYPQAPSFAPGPIILSTATTFRVQSLGIGLGFQVCNTPVSQPISEPGQTKEPGRICSDIVPLQRSLIQKLFRDSPGMMVFVYRVRLLGVSHLVGLGGLQFRRLVTVVIDICFGLISGGPKGPPRA